MRGENPKRLIDLLGAANDEFGFDFGHSMPCDSPMLRPDPKITIRDKA